MGIHDRDYYRREGPSFLASLSPGRVCKWLIALTILVFIVQLATLDRHPGSNVVRGYGAVTEALVLDPDKVLEQGQVWRLVTYAFLHDTNDPLHIIFNLLILWLAGREMEEVYGGKEFLAIYLVGALVGGLAFFVTQINGNAVCLGASGAVLAVLVLFACHFPQRTVMFMFVIPMPMWALAALCVGFDVVHLLSKTEQRVAVAAHLGGAAFGFLYHRLHWRITSLWPDFSRWKKRRTRPHLRVYRGEEGDEVPTPVGVGAPTHPPAESDEHLEAKLDAVLEKMSQVGKENLTEGEREILLKAAEFYRRRRT